MAILGAALTGDLVKAQDLANDPQGRSSTVSALLPYQIRSEDLPTLQPERFGISLIEGSSAGRLFDAVAQQAATGARPDPTLVRDLFRAVTTERGTSIQPDRVRWFISMYPEDSVRVEILKFIYFAPNSYLSTETLRKFWDTGRSEPPDAEVTRWMLLNRSKSIDATVPEEFFSNLRNSPLPDVRIATTLALISSGHQPIDLTSLEIIRASSLLTQDHLEAGHEVRLMVMLAERLTKYGKLDLDADKIGGLCAPTLHLIQRALQRYPRLEEILSKAAPEQVDNFCAKILTDLYAAQRELWSRKVISSDTKALVALHYERDFTHALTQSLFVRLKVDDYRFIKAGNLINEPSGDYGPEMKTFSDSADRREFLGGLEEIKTPTPKQDYLKQLRELANEREKPTLAWKMLHGSPRQFWFYQGRAGHEPDDRLRNPRGISDIEVAETIVTEEMLRKGEIDLSNMTIILDACRQYTVAEGILAGIEQIARRSNAKLLGYPCIVALTQPGMYGSLSLATFYKGVNADGDQIAVGDTIYSPFDGGMRDLPETVKEITLEHLLSIGEEIRLKHIHELSDPLRLRALSDEYMSNPNSTNTDSKGLRQIHTQDPAIFSTQPKPLEPFIRDALEASRIEPEGIDLRDREPTFIEISSYGVRREGIEVA
ncbi:MAG: hypothetical protein ACK5Y6_09240 [Pseudomonadota bacterium]